MKKTVLVFSRNSFFVWALFTLFITAAAFGQNYPVPAAEDTTAFAVGVQRTMQLLASSTSQKKNTVKILVYGQSISHGAWWLQVKADLKKRFPNANLIMENKAIGGFSSRELFVPFIDDVLPYNYDLVLFHVYGSQWTYDSIVRNVRTYTTAEMALQNDQGAKGTDDWSDQMAYTIIPAFVQKYKLEMMDVRTPWTEYLKTNNLTQANVTVDGTHLNDQGNYMMGTFISRHLAYKPKFPTDPYGLVRTLEVGKDISFTNGKLNLPFDGTRIEFVSGNTGVNPAPVTVKVDGKKPSEFIGCSYHLRANDSVMVPKYYELHPKDAKRIDWPWSVGTLLKIKRAATLVEEDWTITINNLVTTTNSCKFDFTLVGSVTGNDGNGSVTMAKKSTSPDSSLYGWVGTSPVFVSKSKRVVIGASAWYIPQALENGQSKVSPIVNGYKINWHSTLQATDIYNAPAIKDATIETNTVIAHGLPKGTHNLELVAQGAGDAAIKYIKVYNPYFARPQSALAVDASEANVAISLYPNPATNQININLQEYAGKVVKMEVYSMLGSYVDSFKSTNDSQLSINTASMDAGMYHLRIDLGNDIIVNKKFNIVR